MENILYTPHVNTISHEMQHVKDFGIIGNKGFDFVDRLYGSSTTFSGAYDYYHTSVIGSYGNSMQMSYAFDQQMNSFGWYGTSSMQYLAPSSGFNFYGGGFSFGF